jgi:hypothetical protein
MRKPIRLLIWTSFVCGLLSAQPARALTISELQRDPSLLLNADSKNLQGLATEVSSSKQISGANRTAALQRLKNYEKIQSGLKDCFQNLGDTDSLRRTILSGASMDSCLEMLKGISPVEESSEELSSLARAATFADVHDFLVQRAVRNAARAVHDYRSQFEGASTLPDFDKKEAVAELTRKFCAGCTDEQVRTFIGELRTQARAHPGPSSPRYGISELVRTQNHAIEGLNDRIQEMVDAKNRQDEPGAEAAYQRYLVDYQRFTATPAGAIFLSDAIKDQVGGVFTPDDFQKKYIVTGELLARKHKAMPPYPSCRPGTRCQEESPVLIKKGLEQIERKIAEHTQAIIKARNFEDLLQSDPAMAGQLLVLNPELMSTVCDSAHRVVETEQLKRKALQGAEAFVNAVDAASLGLMLAGGSGVLVKAGAGALRLGVRASSKALLKGAITSSGREALVNAASSAQVFRTTTGRLMARTIQTGAVSEAGHLLTDGANAAFASGHQDLIVASRLARARNDADMKQIAELEQKWNTSISSFAQGAAMNALPLVGGLMKIRATIGTAKKGAAGLAEEVNQDQSLLGLVNQIGPQALGRTSEELRAKAMSSENVAAGLLTVSRMSDQVKAAFAKIAKSGKGISEKLLGSLNEAGKEALSCALP